MGSRLQTAAGQEVWGLGGGSILRALATLGGSLRRLELPSTLGDGPAPDDVQANGLMPSLHVIPGIWTPIAGYSQLSRFLQQRRFGLVEDRPGRPGNLVFLAYDWRLSNRRSAEFLKARVDEVLERWRASAPARSNGRLVLICHSMGGLIARWYVQRLGGAEVTRAVVTLGTPHRGACKTVEQLVNGVRKGPLKTDLTAFARSLPSLHQLLPEYACIADWTGALRKTTEVELPALDPHLIADAMRFHEDLDRADWPDDCALSPVVGIGQPTWTTARIDDEQVTPLDTIHGRERRGDGTVPRLSARPKRLSERDTRLHGVAEGHALLSSHRSVTDLLDFVLTAEDVVYRGGDMSPPAPDAQATGMSTADLHTTDETIDVALRIPSGRLTEVVAFDERAQEVAADLIRPSGADPDGAPCGVARLGPLAPGGYVLRARAPGDPHGRLTPTVNTTTLVLP
jgi:pimeloyl-ACP methyl ester carboxylesterase